MDITVRNDSVEDEGSSLLSFDPGANREITLFRQETRRHSLEENEYRVMALMTIVAMVGTIMLVVDDYQGWVIGIGTVFLILVFVMASQWCLTKLPKWQYYVGTGFMWIAATYTVVRVYLRSDKMFVVALSLWLLANSLLVFVTWKSRLMTFCQMVPEALFTCCNNLRKSVWANIYGHAFALLAVINGNHETTTMSSWFVSVSSVFLNFRKILLAAAPYISFAISSVYVAGRFDEAKKERDNIIKTVKMIDLRGRRSDLLLQRVLVPTEKVDEEKVAAIQKEIEGLEEEIASNERKIAEGYENHIL